MKACRVKRRGVLERDACRRGFQTDATDTWRPTSSRETLTKFVDRSNADTIHWAVALLSTQILRARGNIAGISTVGSIPGDLTTGAHRRARTIRRVRIAGGARDRVGRDVSAGLHTVDNRMWRGRWTREGQCCSLRGSRRRNSWGTSWRPDSRRTHLESLRLRTDLGRASSWYR